MKKGFTLIELLGVIVIIAIIASIIIITIDNSIKNSTVKSCLDQETNIIESYKTYLIDHPGENINGSCKSVKKLQDDGYIDEDLVNPMTREKYAYTSEDQSTKVCVEYDEGYEYKVVYHSSDKACN